MIGHPFAYFAQSKLSRWSSMVGQRVVHCDFGPGAIVNVEQRPKYIPLIHIEFADARTATFNSDVFKTDRFTDLQVPESLQSEYAPWLVEWNREQAKREEIEELEQAKREEIEERERHLDEAAIKGRAEFGPLADRYHVAEDALVTRDGPTALLGILLKLEARDSLTDDEVRELERSGYSNVAATYFHRKFRQTHDLWHLVKACSHLRRDDQPNTVLRISASVIGADHTDRRAYGALLTTVGAAHRDLGRIEQTVELALKAIDASPNSFHPHTLMGAALYEAGDYAKGDEHFARASALGANAISQDGELRGILKKSNEEKRNRMVEYLLAKDPQRYRWAASFLA